MTKKILFLCLIYIQHIKSQDYLGFNQSNYAGITGIYQQPACIVDSRMKFDMNLIGLNLSVYNNYIGLKHSALKRTGSLTNPTFKAFEDTNFTANYLVEKIRSNDKSVYLSNRISGPGFMLNVNHKDAIAISTGIRTYVNIDGVSPDLAKLIYKELNYPSLWVTNLQNKNLNIQTMTWGEYALTYAHIFKEDNEHFFKAGATVKLLQGIQSAFIFIKDLDYNFKNSDTLSLFQSEVKYGHSDNFNFENQKLGGTNSGAQFFDFSQATANIGADFGLVYEWRPNYKKFKYDLDGEKDLWYLNKNKYKLKIGVSVTDLGVIKFKKGATSGDFKADVNFWNIKPINPKTIRELDDTLHGRFGGARSGGEPYKMNLPTAISFQIDYNIWKDFYLNCMPFFALQFKNNETKVHDFSSISVTPRWDHKWFGAFIPVQYNVLDGYRTGLAIRLGPLVLGTSNILPLIGNNTLYGADIYALVKVPVPFRRVRDRDHDGVSNKRDLCIDVPGVWEFMGCPDKDGDHIQDKDDKCPDVPGIKELQGCPDKDVDGITDLEDNCPDEKGLAEFKGCPDRDGDKIIDSEDECPDIAGLPEFFGCPDRDHDGTPDMLDACPDFAGPKEFKGCPDKDGDTVLDKDDNCPDVAGAVENKGCPWPDTDKDGVADREDECPTVAGLKQLKGCPPAPVLKPEEVKILERAFASLEFTNGKDIIKPISKPSLIELGALMKEHPKDWVLKLSGHTDNKGNIAKNTLLSEKRAKAVKKFLIGRGVKADKILTEWFGPTKPIADNNTEAGRQKNRRVEMKVEFKK